MIEFHPYTDSSVLAQLKVELKAYPELDYSLTLIQNIKWKDKSLALVRVEYVCAWAPVYKDGEIDHWGQGHYFRDIDDAISYMHELEEKYERRCQ